ncbi:MAG TPA: N-acetylmuramoyl-L-alanine amidase [Acidobacteriota bacterium]
MKRIFIPALFLLFAAVWFSFGQDLQFFSENKRSNIEPREHNHADYYSLRDVAAIFSLAREERSPQEFVLRGPKGSVFFFRDRAEIRVNGEMVSLNRPVWRRKDEHWYVTSDFFDKALPRIIGVQLVRRSATSFELQAPAPPPEVRAQLRIQTAVSPDHVRLILEPSQAADFQVRDAGSAVEISSATRFAAPSVPTLPNQPFVGRISYDAAKGMLRVEKGPNFQSRREQTLENPPRKVVDFYGPPAVPETLPPPPTSEVPVLPPIGVTPDIPAVQAKKFVRRPNRNVIVLDSGHGGSDLGVHPTTELMEKNLTLVLAQNIKAAIEAAGTYRVVITRQGDTLMPILHRTAIANSFQAEAFVSLHFGGSYDTQLRGPRVYFYQERLQSPAASQPAAEQGQEQTQAVAAPLGLKPWRSAQASFAPRSRLLAERLQLKLNEVFGRSDAQPGTNQFLVLQGSISPAVILEAGYLSNPDEAKFLAEPKNMKAVAGVIATGILDFLGTK